jgi:hypothetical protein
MTRFLRRALCAAAGVLALAGATQAGAATFEPLQSPSFGPIPDVRVSQETASVALLGDVDLGVGSKVDLVTAPVDPAHAHAFDGLFLAASSAGMPYAALANGGDFAGVGTSLSRNLRLSAGLQSVTAGASTFTPDVASALAHLAAEPAPFAQRSADALVAGVSWDAAKWASFGLTASNIDERDGVLGAAAPGSNANTTALGLSARVRFGNGWSTTASYSEGISQLDLRAGVMPALGNADSLHTRSYGIAIAKKGLFGDDTLGLAVSQPALSGGDFITMPGDTAAAPDFFARNHLLDQVGHAQETDVEIGYVTSFLDGSLALQTNASFQMNYAGQNGQNAVSLLSRARIKF